MNFYLAKGDQKIGPYSTEQIEIFLKQRLVTTTDQVWADGWPSWIPIANVPGLGFQPEIQQPASPRQDSKASISAIPVTPSTKFAPRSKQQPATLLYRGIPYFIVFSFLLFCAWEIDFFGLKTHTFGFVAESKPNAISSVLKQNAVFQNNYNTEKNGIKITSDSDIDHLAQITQDYASQLKTIDASGCPSDFCDAFADYTNKVANLAGTLSQHPHVTTDGEAALSVLVIAAIAQQGGEEGLNQAGQVVADENNTDTAYVRECEQRERQVKEAAESVDAIATKYGVKIQN